MQGRRKWETARRQYRPPRPVRWIPPRAERAFQACWVFGYLAFLCEFWTLLAEELDAGDTDPREAVLLLKVMTERLWFVEWPANEDDLQQGLPMFDRIAASEQRNPKGKKGML